MPIRRLLSILPVCAAILLASSVDDQHRRRLPYQPPPCYGCGAPNMVFGGTNHAAPADETSTAPTIQGMPNPRASRTGGTGD